MFADPFGLDIDLDDEDGAGVWWGTDEGGRD